jgi:hypothetical protein
MDAKGAVNILSPADGKKRMSLEAVLNGARLRMRDPANKIAGELSAALNATVLALGGSGFDGNIVMKNAAGKTTITVNGRDGDIILNNAAGKQTVRLSGPNGDIMLHGADAAEDFEIVGDGDSVSAGTVMVIDSAGKLRESSEAYDRRVAGIVSARGADGPGIILGQNQTSRCQRPIALVGKVSCKADATIEPIEVGDLLTSSTTPGHAMKASDPRKAFGAVIGKALHALPSGQGQIPVLVALQ